MYLIQNILLICYPPTVMHPPTFVTFCFATYLYYRCRTGYKIIPFGIEELNNQSYAGYFLSRIICGHPFLRSLATQHVFCLSNCSDESPQPWLPDWQLTGRLLGWAAKHKRKTNKPWVETQNNPLPHNKRQIVLHARVLMLKIGYVEIAGCMTRLRPMPCIAHLFKLQAPYTINSDDAKIRSPNRKATKQAQWIKFLQYK